MSKPGDVLEKYNDFNEKLLENAQKGWDEATKEFSKATKKGSMFFEESFKFYNQNGLWWKWYAKFWSAFTALWILTLYVLIWRITQIFLTGLIFYTALGVAMGVITLMLLGYMGLEIQGPPNEDNEKAIERREVFQAYNGYLAGVLAFFWVVFFVFLLVYMIKNWMAFTNTLNPMAAGTFNYASVTDNSTVDWGFGPQPGLYPVYNWYVVTTVLSAITMLPVSFVIVCLVYIAYKAKFFNSLYGVWDSAVKKIDLINMGKSIEKAEKTAKKSTLGLLGHRHMHADYLDDIYDHKSHMKTFKIPKEHAKEITRRIKHNYEQRAKKRSKRGEESDERRRHRKSKY